ncbi:hypothetical protein Psch_02207 [Pelotomaculum schinkii]|uniref:Uncharacterized protein n=1 Tax=Pelotomaculum schinkii TaxID=78350 RepID=A0A4Y7RIL4_9FIRM|nr:hypothetical protein [Pelotomaculum schinkii]TEB08641.1 hypothetical protein Psch_02207 [Pelotomaculum schinkii]
MPAMPKDDFQEAFYGFVFERAFKVASYAAQQDPRSIELHKETHQAFDKIKEFLGGDNSLLLDLESAMNATACIVTEYAYRQGLKDGVALKAELGMEQPLWAGGLNERF